MNMLTDKLPVKDRAGNFFNTDFRNFIKFELLMQDKDLNDEQKIDLAIRLFYENFNKLDIKNMCNEILWFYSCGKKDNREQDIEDNEIKKSDLVRSKKKMIYSFEYDDQYIWQSIFSQYHIDVNSIRYLHWWKFKCMLENLDENTIFSQILTYRTIDINKVPKYQKKFYTKMKKRYALPDMRSEEEKENDFANEFS